MPTNSVGTSTGTVGGTVGTYTNVDYKDVTLQLEVVPLINSDHEVTLDILQKIDSIVAGSGTVVNGNSVPTIATRYLKDTVSAPNESTIVLGGLITQDEGNVDNNDSVPEQDSAGGQPASRQHTHNADRNELIILMHPEVVNTDALHQANVPSEEEPYLPRARPGNPTPADGSAQGDSRVNSTSQSTLFHDDARLPVENGRPK